MKGIMDTPIFLTRVVLKNYRSIKSCSVRLGALNFLVGENGAGKSNFLDALRLLTESLNTSLEHALRERGGIGEVRRRSTGHPTHFGVRLEWQLDPETNGEYAFEVSAQEKGGFSVRQERCQVSGRAHHASYEIQRGELKYSTLGSAPAVSGDRLYLVTLSGLPEFRPLYDALSHMGFYNLNPDVIRDLQPPDPGEVLKRDGCNLASVLSVMQAESPDIHGRIVDFLSKVVPGIEHVGVQHIGKKAALEFRQRVGKTPDAWRFPAENMSDGTLRALGVLTALFQTISARKARTRFIGIEEPETALHPWAAGVLRDALMAASHNTQVVVTSHSPDLLDDKDISDENIIAVSNMNGETTLGPIDDASRDAIRDRLYTPGELLRLNRIEISEGAPKAAELFPQDE